MEQRTTLCLILYVNKIDGYQYDSSASYGNGMYCRFGGGFKKSLQNMSPKLTKLARHFATPPLQYPSATFL